MKTMKKKLAVAVTVALLAFPLSTTLAMAETTILTTTAPASTSTDTTDTTDTTILQAEVAVAAYEAGPITTLAEVATAESLKVAADAAVAAVGDGAEKVAFELRITNRAEAIAAALTALTPVVDDNGNTVTPANWLTDLIAKLQLALTFDSARKCELNERHALAKLAKAQKLTMDGKTEAAQICLNQYTDKVTQAQAFLDQVEDPTSEAAITLTKALANVNINNIQVLSNLVDKLPPQAAQKLALNVVRSMEKAINKTQKEEAVVAPVVTPEVTPVATTETEKKYLKKQAKVALAEFKKSINQKGKIHIEDINLQEDEDKNGVEQSKPEQEKSKMEEQQLETQSQATRVTVAPVKSQTAPSFRASENNKDDRNKHADSKKDNGDNRRDH